MRFLFLFLYLLLPSGCVHRQAPATPVPAATVAATPVAVGFASPKKLQEHFAKHGRDFGCSSAEQYLELAQTLRDAAPSDQILESRRGDGVSTRFDRHTGAFLAFSPDGTIRTFFRPNDGEAYFRRQLRKHH